MSRQSGRTQKFHVCSRWLTAALLRRKLDYRFGSIVFLGCLRHFRVRISLSILASGQRFVGSIKKTPRPANSVFWSGTIATDLT